MGEYLGASNNRIHFSGASDDLIEISGAVEREYNSTDETFIVCGTLRVRVFYDDAGCWSISVGLVDKAVEDIDIPSMDIGRSPDTPYSMELVVFLMGTGVKADKTYLPTVIREAGDGDG